MPKKRKNVKRKLLTFIVTGGILSFLYSSKELISNINKIAEVPWDVRNELYYSDILDDYDYFKENGRYTSKGVFMKKATDSDYLLDKFVTYESLKKLTSLEIHMQNTDNLEFLNKCPNVKIFYINEAEFLTDEDINIINKSDIEKIVLSFNVDNIKRIKENKFDISRIKKDVVINNSFYSFIDDLDQLTFYNYLINYNDSMFSDQQNLESIKNMDNYFNDVIKEYRIDTGKTDREKIILISNYICNNLHYDESVKNHIDEYYEELKENDDIVYESNEKSKEYNYHCISSILNQNMENKSGVCINYASIFDILCYKVGIKSRLVDGLNTDVKIGHAWNLVYLPCERDYVDLTFNDNVIVEDILSSFASSRESNKKDIISNLLFMDIVNNYSNYNLYTNIDDLDKELEKEYEYNVNEGIDGYYMIKDDIRLKPFLIYYISGGLIGVSLEEILKRKKVHKKILK